jgi:hypothetical protein
MRHLVAVRRGESRHGPRIHDARIAAVGLSHGVQAPWTVDGDFSRFPALEVENPLAG